MSKIIRNCIVVILVIVPFCSVSAQDEGTVLFGPIAGGNFSQMLEGGLKEIQPGFSAGMFVRWRLGTVFATRMELQYSQRGGKRIWEGGIVPRSESSLRIHELEFPLLLEIALPGTSNQRPRLLIGPVLSKVLESKYSSRAALTSGPTEVSGEDGQTEIGMTVGFGFYSARRHSFLLDLRLSWMLASLSGPGVYKDRTIQVMVGYAL